MAAARYLRPPGGLSSRLIDIGQQLGDRCRFLDTVHAQENDHPGRADSGVCEGLSMPEQLHHRLL
jgi:hypothetical protein